jgi:hypothetical protein
MERDSVACWLMVKLLEDVKGIWFNKTARQGFFSGIYE